ncbi:hypothetical protein SDC9_180419 [bioreactor metagenome]|uniref:Uncharacterized protein n=1 Tax=bioreactor metagenome TaxID=1076179 RepID=A0A645H371_9ZZZZ
MAKQQTVLGAGSQQAIWLYRPFCDQIIDHDTDIAIAAFQDERFFSLHSQRCIDTGDDALSGSFFITGCSVCLTSCKQILNQFCLQGKAQLMRFHDIVLDGVACPHHLGIFHPRHGTDQIKLNIFRQ